MTSGKEMLLLGLGIKRHTGQVALSLPFILDCSGTKGLPTLLAQPEPDFVHGPFFWDLYDGQLHLYPLYLYKTSPSIRIDIYIHLARCKSFM